MQKVLITGGTGLIGSYLSNYLTREGYKVSCAEGGKKAISMIKKSHFDLLLCDIRLCDISGLDVLRAAKKQNPHIVVILISAYASAETAVEAASQQVGGETLDDSDKFWISLREHQIMFFQNTPITWRISVPQTTKPLPLNGSWLVEWGGGLRWLATDDPMEKVFSVVSEAGGHACFFRGGDHDQEVFQPLNTIQNKLHMKLKQSFDPNRIFNIGKLYKDF